MFEKFFENFFNRFKKKPLTGKAANLISKYGTDCEFEKIIQSEIEKIECQILNKLEFSRRERLLALLVPPEQKELFDCVKSNFEEKGFKTFYAGKENISELGENIYLFISWDID